MGLLATKGAIGVAGTVTGIDNGNSPVTQNPQDSDSGVTEKGPHGRRIALGEGRERREVPGLCARSRRCHRADAKPSRTSSSYTLPVGSPEPESWYCLGQQEVQHPAGTPLDHKPHRRTSWMLHLLLSQTVPSQSELRTFQSPHLGPLR